MGQSARIGTQEGNGRNEAYLPIHLLPGEVLSSSKGSRAIADDKAGNHSSKPRTNNLEKRSKKEERNKKMDEWN